MNFKKSTKLINVPEKVLNKQKYKGYQEFKKKRDLEKHLRQQFPFLSAVYIQDAINEYMEPLNYNRYRWFNDCGLEVWRKR